MMMNQTDLCLKSIPALRLLMSQRNSPELKQEGNLLCRKRSSSEVSSSSTPSVKRQRPAQSNEVKVLPSKVGLTSYGLNDVLSGRGGGTNQHEGNCFFRSLINENREKYLRAKKNDKPFISLSIVNIIRRRNGRFLKRDEASGLWFEIGDAQAREKTSQALRQRAPEYRKQLFEQDIKKQTTLRHSVTPPGSPAQILSNKCTNIDAHHQKIIREALRVRARQSEIQEAREVLRLHQKAQAIKLLELKLMLQSSNWHF